MTKTVILDTEEKVARDGNMDFKDYIESRPGFRSGKPCFKGTRITVYDVLEYLEGGMTEDELLADFPILTPQHILAARAFSDAHAPVPRRETSPRRKS